jgi:ankyrin repeat protein
MDSLRGNKSAKSIQRALENLLTGSRAYDDEYAKTLERIAGQLPETRNLAHEVISWISLAKRPLTVSELQHALTIEPGESQLDESNSPDVEAMVSACLGLVTVDESSQIIRLVHLTIQEYLERDTPAWLQDFKTTMAISCLTLLSFDEFQDGPCFRSDLQHRLQRNPLYEYAASHWGHHYHDCGQGYPATGTESLGVKFLRNYQKVEAAGQVMWLRRAGSLYGLDHGRDIHLPWVPHCGITGVHLAASFGLDTTLQALIDGGEFPDPKDGYGGTPLLWAVEQGRVGSVNILTDMSTVNLDAVGFRFRTPISIAAENGFLEIVKILVAKGVDIRQTDRFGLNPLSHAAYNCQLEVVRFLLELDPSQPHLDCQNIYGETALSRAIVRRDEKVVRLLLDKGANPNGGAEFGKEVTVSVLPGSKKADPYAPYLRKLTPLSYAVRSRHAGLCTLLLAAPRIDPNITDHYGWSPLMCAASYGYKSMVSLLLQDTRVDPNLPNPWKQTPLLRAALMGHTAVMAKLLERPDVDADRGGQIGRTPLSISAITGNHQAVELLLRHGVNPVTPDHHGRTPLAWAARSGGEAVVTQLLGANIASSMSPAGVPHVDWADKRGRTALFWAAKTGSGPVVKALLEAGARLEIADRSGRTALYVAVEGNHIEVTRVLLQELEPSEAVADKLAEAIDLAAFMQHCEVENILRERVGWPNIDVDDSFGITTLFSS